MSDDIQQPLFKMHMDAVGRCYFVLHGPDGDPIAKGYLYNDNVGCLKAIEIVKAIAHMADIDDEITESTQKLYSDDSIFPYGKQHKGKRFEDVPAGYFMWIHESKAWREDLSLHAYIEDNMDAFKMEMRNGR